MTTILTINLLLSLAALAAVFGVAGLVMRGLAGSDVEQTGQLQRPSDAREPLAPAA
jgi:hypothetical protein